MISSKYTYHMAHFQKPALLAAAVLSLLLASGCGKKAEVYDPPNSRAELVIELNKALLRKDHASAVKKVERLRKLDPSNVFLANLEISERNNGIIAEAQELLDKGDYDSAARRIGESMKSFGMQESLSAAKAELDKAAEIAGILSLFESGDYDSTKLARCSARLKEFSSASKDAQIFLPLAEDRLKEAAVLQDWERERTAEDLLSDYDMLLAAKDPLAETVLANIAIFNPKLPIISKYLDYISASGRNPCWFCPPSDEKGKKRE